MSFLPLPDGGYLLGTNRDESPRRGPARPPELREYGGARVLAPTDTDAGGTWIAVDADGRCLCILNGDRPPAVPPAADAPSRGLLVLELMAAPEPELVLAELERRRAAGSLREKPFKLLVVQPGDAERPADLHWIEWDGARLARARHDAALVAVSSTYQPDAVEAERRRLFAPLAAYPRHDVAALADAQSRWHAAHREAAPDGDAWCVCMHRPDAQTVSSTRVRVHAGEVSMDYVAGHPCEAGARRPARASFPAAV